MNKKMLIFGGAGSLGTELTKFYIDQYEIICVSRDEAKHWALHNKFHNKNLKTIIGDVRDENRIYDIILEQKPDVIIIAQALKQIDICEKFPEESLKTNTNGIINITNAIKRLCLNNMYFPTSVCFVSTDKAAGPISVYGMCKSISEKIMFNFSDYFDNTNTRIIVVRYGNVASSKGSIIPLLLQQSIDSTVKNYTLTNELMTRFLMTLNEAAKLIDTAITNGKNGDLWVPKLSSIKIIDLISYFSKKYNKPFKITGLRCIEKIDEIMLTREESIKVDIQDQYFVLQKQNEIKNNLISEYSSKNYLLNEKELSLFLDNFLPTLEDL